MSRVPGTPRIPSRHDAPVTPLEMSEADAVAFAAMVSSGWNGQAPWLRACACNHPAKFHARDRCMLCSCRGGFRRADHEVLLIDLHPDAVNYLPPDVTVLQVGNKVKALGPDGRGGTMMGVSMILSRDVSYGRVIRSGLHEETTVYTSPPDDMEEA